VRQNTLQARANAAHNKVHCGAIIPKYLQFSSKGIVGLAQFLVCWWFYLFTRNGIGDFVEVFNLGVCVEKVVDLK